MTVEWKHKSLHFYLYFSIIGHVQKRVTYSIKIVVDDMGYCPDMLAKLKITNLPWRQQCLMAETCNIGKGSKIFMALTRLHSQCMKCVNIKSTLVKQLHSGDALKCTPSVP